MMVNNYLVGGIITYPSEKWWNESQLGWWHSQYMENMKNKSHVPNHQSAMIGGENVQSMLSSIGAHALIPQEWHGFTDSRLEQHVFDLEHDAFVSTLKKWWD